MPYNRKITDSQIIRYWEQQRHPSKREIARHFGCAERTIKKVVEANTKKSIDIHQLHEKRILLELELNRLSIVDDEEAILKELEPIYKLINQ